MTNMIKHLQSHGVDLTECDVASSSGSDPQLNTFLSVKWSPKHTKEANMVNLA